MFKQEACKAVQQLISSNNKFGAPEYEESFLESHMRLCDKCRKFLEQTHSRSQSSMELYDY